MKYFSVIADKSAALRNLGVRGVPLFKIRNYFLFALALVAICVSAWIERAVILRGAADLWIESDSLTPADAIVVLGGELELRPFVAADLYAKGFAKKILLSQIAEDRPVHDGRIPGHTELNRKILLRSGVSESAILPFGVANKNTWEEAVALKRWSDRHLVSAFIIPTDSFSARRLRWTFRRVFAPTAINIEVIPFDAPGSYTRDNWWKHEDGLITFKNEVLKYLYYRLKY